MCLLNVLLQTLGCMVIGRLFRMMYKSPYLEGVLPSKRLCISDTAWCVDCVLGEVS